MPINVKCPYCEKTVSARDELAGKSVDCPSCMTQLDIPKEPWQPSAEIFGADAKEAKDIDNAASYYIDSCPHCGRVVSAPQKLLWVSGKCPNCKKPLGEPPMTPLAQAKERKAQGRRKSGLAPKPPTQPHEAFRNAFVAGVF